MPSVQPPVVGDDGALFAPVHRAAVQPAAAVPGVADEAVVGGGDHGDGMVAVHPETA